MTTIMLSGLNLAAAFIVSIGLVKMNMDTEKTKMDIFWFFLFILILILNCVCFARGMSEGIISLLK